MHTHMKPCIVLLLTIAAFASVAVGQSTKDKIEIGVQTTSLTLINPEFTTADQTEAGIGGRFTFNFNRFVAAEAEVVEAPPESPDDRSQLVAAQPCLWVMGIA